MRWKRSFRTSVTCFACTGALECGGKNHSGYPAASRNHDGRHAADSRAIPAPPQRLLWPWHHGWQGHVSWAQDSGAWPVGVRGLHVPWHWLACSCCKRHNRCELARPCVGPHEDVGRDWRLRGSLSERQRMHSISSASSATWSVKLPGPEDAAYGK